MLNNRIFRLLELFSLVISVISICLVLLYQSIGAIVFVLNNLVLGFFYIRYFPVLFFKSKGSTNPYIQDFIAEVGLLRFLYCILFIIIFLFTSSLILLIGFLPFKIDEAIYIICGLVITFILVGIFKIKDKIFRKIWLNGQISILLIISPYIVCYLLMRYSGFFGP